MKNEVFELIKTIAEYGVNETIIPEEILVRDTSIEELNKMGLETRKSNVVVNDFTFGNNTGDFTSNYTTKETKDQGLVIISWVNYKKGTSPIVDKLLGLNKRPAGKSLEELYKEAELNEPKRQELIAKAKLVRDKENANMTRILLMNKLNKKKAEAKKAEAKKKKTKKTNARTTPAYLRGNKLSKKSDYPKSTIAYHTAKLIRLGYDVTTMSEVAIYETSRALGRQSVSAAHKGISRRNQKGVKTTC